MTITYLSLIQIGYQYGTIYNLFFSFWHWSTEITNKVQCISYFFKNIVKFWYSFHPPSSHCCASSVCVDDCVHRNPKTTTGRKKAT